MNDDAWYQSQANLAELAHYMAHIVGSNAKDVAYAIEKPWKHEDEWREARALLDLDIDIEHIRRHDGSCVISVNGQGHLPCAEHSLDGDG